MPKKRVLLQSFGDQHVTTELYLFLSIMTIQPGTITVMNLSLETVNVVWHRVTGVAVPADHLVAATSIGLAREAWEHTSEVIRADIALNPFQKTRRCRIQALTVVLLSRLQQGVHPQDPEQANVCPWDPEEQTISIRNPKEHGKT